MGNRETLKILQEVVPLKIKEYNSGEQVYDWTIPDEYTLRDAWIKDETGTKVIDFNNSNMHVMSYSVPVKKKIRFKELAPKLHYINDLPNAIPYRTTYYSKDCGFCVTKNQFDILSKKNGYLDVYIDSEFNSNGSMVIGELLLKGQSEKEILIPN